MRQVVGVPAFVDYAMTPGNALDDMANVAAASIVISLLVYALLFLIVTPLSQGVLAWYYRRTGGADDSLTTIFSYFEQAGTYFRSIGLHFMIGLKMFFWALLLYSPLFAMAAMFIISGGDQPRAVILFAFLLSVVWLLIHNSSVSVSVGQTVKQGEKIANVGSTGNSTGNHLHLELRINGVRSNVLPYISYHK